MVIGVDSDVTIGSNTKINSRERLADAVRLIRSIVSFHRGLFITAVGGAALFAVCTVASSIGVRWMVDRVILVRFNEGRLDLGALVTGSILVIGIGLLRAVGVVVRRSFAGKTEWRTAETITNSVIDHVAAQPVKWHRKLLTGDIVARCGIDADASVAILAPLPFASSVVVMSRPFETRTPGSPLPVAASWTRPRRWVGEAAAGDDRDREPSASAPPLRRKRSRREGYRSAMLGILQQ